MHIFVNSVQLIEAGGLVPGKGLEALSVIHQSSLLLSFHANSNYFS
jgi:hypothetical protein